MLGLILGYEIVGEVVVTGFDVGEGIFVFEVGQCVVLELFFFCCVCGFCLEKCFWSCETGWCLLGDVVFGGFAEFVCVYVVGLELIVYYFFDLNVAFVVFVVMVLYVV